MSVLWGLLGAVLVLLLVLVARVEGAHVKLDTLLAHADPAKLDALRQRLKVSGDALDATIKANQP